MIPSPRTTRPRPVSQAEIRRQVEVENLPDLEQAVLRAASTRSEHEAGTIWLRVAHQGVGGEVKMGDLGQAGESLHGLLGGVLPEQDLCRGKETGDALRLRGGMGQRR